MRFDAVYYEPGCLNYPLGKRLKKDFEGIPWIPIESHNRIAEMQQKENKEFAHMKRNLILGVRKTHRYTENKKISDYLVPYTSSGCTAMCLYCYLVCNYNKCAYLRLFVNREEMLERLLRFSHETERPCTFEIGSNSDLVLENNLTGNLSFTIERFAREGRGFLTFPTKFSTVSPLLTLPHGGKTIFRMSVNPEEIIRRVEMGTAPLNERIAAVNRMCEAGYPCGLLIAPVILTGDWKARYSRLLETLERRLSPKVKQQMFLEIILMTYSYVHRKINEEAFPNAPQLYDSAKMMGRGPGKYAYRPEPRGEAEQFLRAEIRRVLGNVKIAYIS